MVDNTNPVSDIASSVGRTVRRYRGERGWSLEALVARANVSKSVLISIEQGKSNPNLATLVRLAEAFGLPVTALVQEDVEPRVKLIGPERAVQLWTGKMGGSGVLVAGADPPSGLELWHFELFPGENHRSEAHAAGTKEVIYVTSGSLTLTGGDTTIVVPEGSSAVFGADQPHGYANAGATRCVFTLVSNVIP